MLETETAVEQPFFLSEKTVGEDVLYPDEPPRFHRGTVEKFFVWASEIGASDITIKTGDQIFLEVDGKMRRVTKHFLDHSEVMEMVVAMYGSETAKGILAGDRDLDFPYQINPDRNTKYRYRVNAVGITVNGGMGCEVTARTIPGIPPKLSDLNLEPGILENIAPKQGMIVITGGTGSGKSTLLASIIRQLAEDPNGHRKIITYESPIEYVYDDVIRPSTSLAQTEIGKSLASFVEGTRNALRRKPGIILLGEARDAETIGEAVTASMTGHLLYTTIHSNGFADTIRRMVNVFSEEKNARAVDIISSLKMIISQRLVPATNGKRVALREFVVMNDEIVDFLLEAGIENLTASCRTVLKNHGQSFLEDASRKLEQGLIDHQVWKEIARVSKAEEMDAQEIIRRAQEKGQMLDFTLLPHVETLKPPRLEDVLDPSSPALSSEDVQQEMHTHDAFGFQDRNRVNINEKKPENENENPESEDISFSSSESLSTVSSSYRTEDPSWPTDEPQLNLTLDDNE